MANSLLAILWGFLGGLLGCLPLAVWYVWREERRFRRRWRAPRIYSVENIAWKAETHALVCHPDWAANIREGRHG